MEVGTAEGVAEEGIGETRLCKIKPRCKGRWMTGEKEQPETGFIVTSFADKENFTLRSRHSCCSCT